ncbi:hypothetical protein B296_00057767 [Ensete ventricosum]|uniref:Uncharacterized protein n=1 Tax=Ensete ventricosum TaxID=4639 RepID=A0A426XBI9_ENSVE|nr:hypothetical protein B296_00057767 [Ensete ventricosum]
MEPLGVVTITELGRDFMMQKHVASMERTNGMLCILTCTKTSIVTVVGSWETEAITSLVVLSAASVPPTTVATTRELRLPRLSQLPRLSRLWMPSQSPSVSIASFAPPSSKTTLRRGTNSRSCRHSSQVGASALRSKKHSI